MHDEEEFFSPQALRLLEADNENHLPASQDPLCLFTDDSSVMPRHQQQPPPSKSSTTARDLPGTSTFSLAADVEPKRKRAKFEPERRLEVAHIRKRGACLRCRLMKIACSGEMPCKGCARSQNTCRAREPKYRWMHCVPFSLKEVDIFSLHSSVTDEVYNGILFRNDRFLTEKVQLFDAGRVVDLLDFESTALDFANWISKDQFYRESGHHITVSSMSRTGVISSAQFQLLISNFLGKELSESLRILVETSSVLYKRSIDVYAGYDFTDLERLQSFSGTRVLHYLERALSVKALAQASAEVLQSLFMALTGTILSIGHMREGLVSRSYASNGSYLNAKQHLVNVLAHHMIYIADRLAFVNGDATKAALIETAHSQWGRQPQFEWVGWNDVVLNTDFGTSMLPSRSSNLLESQSPTIPVGASVEHGKEPSTIGPLSPRRDLRSDRNSALERYGPCQGHPISLFDNPSVDDHNGGPAEMLRGNTNGSYESIHSWNRLSARVSLDEQSTVFQPETAEKVVESRCTSCGVRNSAEWLRSHDGCCEDCWQMYNLDLPWPVMDPVTSGGKTLSRRDSQTSGIVVPQESTAGQAHESTRDMPDIHAYPARSRNKARRPWIGGQKMRFKYNSKEEYIRARGNM